MNFGHLRKYEFMYMLSKNMLKICKLYTYTYLFIYGNISKYIRYSTKEKMVYGLLSF